MQWLFLALVILISGAAVYAFGRVLAPASRRAQRSLRSRNSISKADLTALIEKFKTEACTHCGGLHAMACPRVKSFSFAPNGGIASVEFWPWNQWPRDNIEFPHELLARPVVEDREGEG